MGARLQIDRLSAIQSPRRGVTAINKHIQDIQDTASEVPALTLCRLIVNISVLASIPATTEPFLLCYPKRRPSCPDRIVAKEMTRSLVSILYRRCGYGAHWRWCNADTSDSAASPSDERRMMRRTMDPMRMRLVAFDSRMHDRTGYQSRRRVNLETTT